MPSLSSFIGTIYVGTQGVQGSTGTQGLQGTQGFTGSQGAQGAQGIQGAQGTQGFTGSQGAQGIQGLSGTSGNAGGIPYTFSTTTVDEDPGNGVIRYNNSTIGSVTFIYIDNNDSNSNVQTTWYDTWDDSTNPNQEGYLIIQGSSPTNTTVNVWSITGAVTIASGYYKIPVAHISGSLPGNGVGLIVQFSRTGNQGSQGSSGSQGAQGTQGFTGSQGAQGIAGSGSQGAQGAQGTQGFSPVGIPSSSNTTLASTDAGKLVIIDAAVAINASTGFAIGDMCTIYNVGVTTRTITPSSVTLRWAGTTSTATRYLSPKGLGNIVCVASNDYVISGAGLT